MSTKYFELLSMQTRPYHQLIYAIIAMIDRNKYQLLTYFIATVWLINGLFCKLLNFVPRHQEIVTRILGNSNARLFTVFIGLSEIIMAIWITSKKWKKMNTITQLLVITAMNILEFLLVPDLLLWGRANAVFALLFILIIY